MINPAHDDHRPTNAAVLDMFFDQLADLVATKVAAKLSSPTDHYGAGKAATLPPGKSRSWALRTLKTIPGARKVGRDWIVSVADFDAWAAEEDARRCAEKPTTSVPKRGPVACSLSMADRAERSLAASGHRPTR